MRKRKVFGRRIVKRGEFTYRLEMRADKIVARALFSPKEHAATLDQIVDVLTGQLPLRIN